MTPLIILLIIIIFILLCYLINYININTSIKLSSRIYAAKDNLSIPFRYDDY
jgi:hypothetical protein